MKRHNVILESNVEPKDNNVLWLQGNKLKKFGNTGWENIIEGDVVTTDRIENGAVTTDKIAPNAFDSTLSKSEKIAPADVVGNKITMLDEKVDALALGKFYGYFPNSASLPTDMTTPGYAYVGLDNPYKIWNFNGESWSDSGTSIDMNDADEEDITRNTDGKLQFKNRAYGDGMGYVILRKDKTFAEQVTKENTIYEIRYDFALNGEEVNIPANCVLSFKGGKLQNGKMTGSNTRIESAQVNIFHAMTFSGTYCLTEIPLLWFDVKLDDSSYDSSVGLADAIALSTLSNTKIKVPKGKFYILEPIRIETNSVINIEGCETRIGIYGKSTRDNNSVFTVSASSMFTGGNLGEEQYSPSASNIKGRISGIYVAGKPDRSNYMFYNTHLSNFLLENCTIGAFDSVIRGTVTNCANIINNRIEGIKHLIHWESKYNHYALVDSEISGNYINGITFDGNARYVGSETSLIKGLVTFSRITSNFIDFFKYLFSNSVRNEVFVDNVIIANNMIDYCYSMSGNNLLQNFILEGNTINGCSWDTAKNTTWGNTDAQGNYLAQDEDLVENSWCFIKNVDAMSSCNIVNNTFHGDIFLYSKKFSEIRDVIVENNNVLPSKIFVHFPSLTSEGFSIQGVDMRLRDKVWYNTSPSFATKLPAIFNLSKVDGIQAIFRYGLMNKYSPSNGTVRAYNDECVQTRAGIYHLSFLSENPKLIAFFSTDADYQNLRYQKIDGCDTLVDANGKVVELMSKDYATLREGGRLATNIYIADIDAYLSLNSNDNYSYYRGDCMHGSAYVSLNYGNVRFVLSSLPNTGLFPNRVVYVNGEFKKYTGTEWVNADDTYYPTLNRGLVRPPKMYCMNGELFFDETLTPPRWITHNGTDWVNLDGTPITS